jgi:hypothetical protein
MAAPKHPTMRSAILTGLVMTTALFAASSARANQWCGSATKDNAVIECGYTTASQCEDAVGKGGMCFVDPDVVLNSKHAAHTNPLKARRG